jgi:hypothetical protein
LFAIIIIFSSVFAQENFTNQDYFEEAITAKTAEKEANNKVIALKAERKLRSCTGICETKWNETQKKNIAMAEAEAAKKEAEAEVAVRRVAEYLDIQYLEAEREIGNIIIENEYKNFTDRQRIATIYLNFFIPTAGSLFIMDDIKGAAIQWGLFGGSILYATYFEATYSQLAIGLVIGMCWGFFRPLFYDKPKPNNTAYLQRNNFNAAILPDKQNNFRMYLLYNKAF